MRDYDSPNPSSRVAWCVAGVAGFVLMAWTLGWFDVGGPETGDLVDDPIAGQFDDLESVPFEELPEQFEPTDPVIVDVPPSSGDEWTDPPAMADGAPGEARVAMAEPTIPDVMPPMFDGSPEPDVHGAARPIQPASHEAGSPTTGPTALDLDRIDSDIRAGRIAEAHQSLSEIWRHHPAAHATIRRRIDSTAKTIFFDPEPHFLPPYEVASGDTLRGIGERYGVPWQYVVRLNRVDPRHIRPGQPLKVVRGPFHAVVDLSDFTLTVLNHGHYVKQYAIGVGSEAGNPIGRYTVLDKVGNPRYTAPDGTVVAPDDPNNPLGERWIGLGSGHGIHGSIEPGSIGRTNPTGSIHMLAVDVAEVFDLLGVGSEVLVVR